MTTNGTADGGGAVSKYETEEGLKEVAAFLRGRNGMPLRPAIEMDKRVEYFKGVCVSNTSVIKPGARSCTRRPLSFLKGTVITAAFSLNRGCRRRVLGLCLSVASRISTGYSAGCGSEVDDVVG